MKILIFRSRYVFLVIVGHFASKLHILISSYNICVWFHTLCSIYSIFLIQPENVKETKGPIFVEQLTIGCQEFRGTTVQFCDNLHQNDQPM